MAALAEPVALGLDWLQEKAGWLLGSRFSGGEAVVRPAPHPGPFRPSIAWVSRPRSGSRASGVRPPQLGSVMAHDRVRRPWRRAAQRATGLGPGPCPPLWSAPWLCFGLCFGASSLAAALRWRPWTPAILRRCTGQIGPSKLGCGCAPGNAGRAQGFSLKPVAHPGITAADVFCSGAACPALSCTQRTYCIEGNRRLALAASRSMSWGIKRQPSQLGDAAALSMWPMRFEQRSPSLSSERVSSRASPCRAPASGPATRAMDRPAPQEADREARWSERP